MKVDAKSLLNNAGLVSLAKDVFGIRNYLSFFKDKYTCSYYQEINSIYVMYKKDCRTRETLPMVDGKLLFHYLFRNKFTRKYVDYNKLTIMYEIPTSGSYIAKLDYKTIATCQITKNYFHSDDGETYGFGFRFTYNIIGINCEKYMNSGLRSCNNLKSKNSKEFKRMSKNVINRYGISTRFEQTDRALVKSFDDIIVNADVKERIIGSLDKFYNNYDLYYKNAIPYKIGILLYGQPGTGKSSIASAIASKYDVPLVYIKSEHVLSRMYLNILRQVEADYNTEDINRIKLVVVFEEFDKFFGKSSIEGGIDKEVMNSIIDNLPAGTIIVATANDFNSFEPSVIRKGRFDVKEELSLFDKENGIKMVEKYGLDPSFADQFKYPIAPVDLQFEILQELSHS